MNLNKRFIFTLNLAVILVVFILAVVAIINRVNTQKADAEDMLFEELSYLTTILDLTSDRELEDVKQIFYEKSFYNTGYVSLIDRGGNVLICQHNEGLNLAGEPYFRDIELSRHGNSRYYDETDGQWKWIYFTWYGPEESYLVATIDQYEFITGPVLNIILVLLFAIVLSVFILAIVSFYTTRTISNPINKLSSIVDKLAKGIIPEKSDYEYEDEVGQMTKSVNQLVDGFRRTALFARALENKNFDHEYEPLSKDDLLGNALLDMRHSLKKAVEEEKQRTAENEKRKWVTQGIAKFADILRQNYSDINELSYNIIKHLVEYMSVNQGGIFIINDEKEDEIFLELTACYAYDRRKYMQKQIQPGEGLVGTCFLEKKTIHLSEIPGDYIYITSGLGYDNPSALLIVPLKLNEDIYGVVELASFNEFEDYQVEFVEKIGESIASTISSTRINQKTAVLLEKSQQQAEEMRAQEEEMRQNMEELNATQESMEIRDRENKDIIDKLKKDLDIKENEINQLMEKLNNESRDSDDSDKTDDTHEEKVGEQGDEKNEIKTGPDKDSTSENTIKDIHDKHKSESQQEWSEHLKKSTRKFKKGRKK